MVNDEELRIHKYHEHEKEDTLGSGMLANTNTFNDKLTQHTHFVLKVLVSWQLYCSTHEAVFLFVHVFHSTPLPRPLCFPLATQVLLGLPYDGAIDIWSLGCISVEMFLGLPVFPGVSDHNQICRIVEMTGSLPEFMLENGKDTLKFFKRVRVLSDREWGGRFPLLLALLV